MRHELKRGRPPEGGSLAKSLPSTSSELGHGRLGDAANFSSIETNTMEGLDNSCFDMSRQSQATDPVHGLLKGAHTLLLNRVAPAGPLGVNS
eukprot:2108731-Amphidinium_carterae.1